VFSATEVLGILHGYLDGLHVVFAMAVALAGLSFIVALFAPGERLNLKKAFGIKSESDTESKTLQD
jgi:hypothetical protein